MLTNSTGYAAAAAAYAQPGNFNVSVTYAGNATLGLSGAVAYSACGPRLACLERQRGASQLMRL